MVKHIVMWQVEGHEVHGSKNQVMIKIKEELEGLKNEIDGLVEIEVGININQSAAAYDVVLDSTFVNEEALAYYQAHPKHVTIAEQLVRQVAINRVVVDYIV